MNIPTLVLAAGRSTRIATVAQGRPKPLLEVGGRALLEWNLSWIAAHGVRQAWINLHHEGAAIRAAIGTGERYGLRVSYAEEPVLRGTAGAWKRVAREWRSTSLVVYGDNLMRFDLARLVAAHRAAGRAATVALFEASVHANTGPGGGRAMQRADGRVHRFREGGDAEEDSERINAGVYALEPSVTGWIGEGYQDFGHDVLPLLAEAGELNGHVIEAGGFCLGLDTPERYSRATELVTRGAVVL